MKPTASAPDRLTLLSTLYKLADAARNGEQQAVTKYKKAVREITADAMAWICEQAIRVGNAVEIEVDRDHLLRVIKDADRPSGGRETLQIAMLARDQRIRGDKHPMEADGNLDAPILVDGEARVEYELTEAGDAELSHREIEELMKHPIAEPTGGGKARRIGVRSEGGAALSEGQFLTPKGISARNRIRSITQEPT